MRLYSGTSKQFVEDTVQNQIAEKLKAAFFDHFRYQPSLSEVQSWRNSLRAMSMAVTHAKLDDHGVLLEYQLPLTSKRLDCLLTGRDRQSHDQAVIVELKQWDRCADAEGENEVETFLGGARREVLHPSVQVGQYRMYLEDGHTAFYDGASPIGLAACAYLHNYPRDPGDVLFSPKFRDAIERNPVFTADDVDPLCEFLSDRLGAGGGLDVLRRVEESRYRPSKRLMDHVAHMIKGNPQYVLLDEQLIVYDKVRACARKGFHDRRKSVLIIRGGPGTGKSVIAINLMADLLLEGHNAHYATGSRAFTQTLRKIIGTRGGVQFKYFNSYAEAGRDAVDVLVADEAHRIREVSADRFTPREKRTGKPQIRELIEAAKVCVFFIDDRQVVRPKEIGSVAHIREHASALGATVHEYTLEAQFRCAGSDAFLNWVNNTLGIERTANVLWDEADSFEFRIVGSPEELEKMIRAKSADGCTARLTAGFCWNWSLPNPEGTLKDDVVIGDWRRPWDAKPEARKLAKGIPKADLWAYDPNGINQVGCVYTAQGFEFDYAGVIFGPDLVYDFEKQEWVGRPERSADRMVKQGKGRFTDLVKNTYRVLLSRGLKGCYVHFMDKDTERFFRSRMERPK